MFVRRLAVPLLALAALPCLAQPPASPARQPSAPKGQTMALDPVQWFALAPSGPLGPTAPGKKPPGTIDMTLKADESIIVYGRKKGPDFNTWRQDLGSPHYEEAAMPAASTYRSTIHCAGGAYETIGGQAATGRDVALGGCR